MFKTTTERAIASHPLPLKRQQLLIYLPLNKSGLQLLVKANMLFYEDICRAGIWRGLFVQATPQVPGLRTA